MHNIYLYVCSADFIEGCSSRCFAVSSSSRIEIFLLDASRELTCQETEKHEEKTRRIDKSQRILCRFTGKFAFPFERLPAVVMVKD